MDWIWIVLLIAAIAIIWSLWRSNHSSSTEETGTSTASSTPRTQMVEDIKATKTSRISDVAEILDELSQTSSNYRHYCELVGTSMQKGITAPYSQREVAYYDVRCYRIDYKNGKEVESLVAHECSFDPFYFTDGSSEKPIYVDLASFGTNVILVNSTNHIEGPNSEFAKKLGERLTNAASGTAYACEASVPERLGNMLRGAADALERVLLPGGAPAFGLVAAGAVAGGMGGVGSVGSVGKNVLFAASGNPGGHGGHSHGGAGMGGRPGGGNYGGRPQMPSNGQMPRNGQASRNAGNMGYANDFNDFFNMGMSGNFSYGGRPYSSYSGSDLGTTLLNVGLGALLGSMYSSAQRSTTTTTTTTPQSTFRGYRLIEDVVPLNSPIYCIGEVYKHGTDLYMGRSTDAEYATSFFACKPESEVVAHLKS